MKTKVIEVNFPTTPHTTRLSPNSANILKAVIETYNSKGVLQSHIYKWLKLNKKEFNHEIIKTALLDLDARYCIKIADTQTLTRYILHPQLIKTVTDAAAEPTAEKFTVTPS